MGRARKTDREKTGKPRFIHFTKLGRKRTKIGSEKDYWLDHHQIRRAISSGHLQKRL
jgi:hypothetical protein